MKSSATSKPSFSPEFIAAALAAAPDAAVFDPDNPPTRPEDWDGAVVTRSREELREKLAERRRRGAQKAPRKERVTIRLSSDVVSRFRAAGSGWQTRVDAALRDWLDKHSPAR
jgi:uncharacterized protein (DUF4415 family)